MESRLKILLISAAAAFGLAFFSSLSADFITNQVELGRAVLAAGIYAGLQFFIKVSASLEKHQG